MKDILPDWLRSQFPSVITPQGPKPSCVKHDVAYASLQEFVSESSSEVAADKLDTSWNPRNKHLADAKFHADILKYGCQTDTSNTDFEELCSDKEELAAWMHWGVNKVNNKKWPVTEQDIEHSESSQSFVECEVPNMSNVRLNRLARGVQVSGTYSVGCVPSITVDYYRFCWTVEGTRYNHRTRRDIAVTRDDCTTHDPSSSDGMTIAIPSDIKAWSSLTLKTIEIRPDNIVYGGPFGSETLLGNPFLDPITGGAYYPAQTFNITRNNPN